MREGLTSDGGGQPSLICMNPNGGAGPGDGIGGSRFRPKNTKEQMNPPFLAAHLAVRMKRGFKAGAT